MPWRHATRTRAWYDARACLPAFTTGSSVWEGRARACCCARTTIDLNRLEAGARARGYVGLGAGFCGPCWRDFRPCWAFGVWLLRRHVRGRARCLFSCIKAQCCAGIQYGFGLAWARVRARATTTRFTMLSTGPFAPFWCGAFRGPRTAFWGWPMRWPRRAHLRALAGLLGALAGLCWRRAMLAAWAGWQDAYFHCMNAQCWTDSQHML